jgi:spore coat polysaccharide biosynthesis protein SpsF (cytidylyltransferase family)
LEKNIKKNSKSREHVIGNFKEYINKKFKVKNIIAPKQFNYPNIYFEIDTLKDLTFFKKMYENNNKFFDLNLTNLISMVKKYKLNKINSKVYRRWKRYRDD